VKLGVTILCQVLEVQRSSYYVWKKRPEATRRKDNLKLLERIHELHLKSKGTYGAPRITAQLQTQGQKYNRKRVARLMREAGLFGCARRKFRLPSTTDSRHDLPVAPRVFQVEEPKSHPTAPNQVWVSDTTYIPTEEGWLYLTIQLDVFTRKVVGYSMAAHLRSEAVWESLRQAIQQQPGALSLKQPGLVAHSDRGRQYASDLYRGKLQALGITASMSRSGNCYDNAYAESFFHTLKVELIHRQQLKSRAEAEKAILDYIENWYNCKRLHSGLEYQSPNDYERKALAA
jgi:putative transposase